METPSGADSPPTPTKASSHKSAVSLFHVAFSLSEKIAVHVETAKKKIKASLSPYMTEERDPEKLQAQDIRTARFWEITESSTAFLHALASLILYVSPVFFLVDWTVITPLIEGDVPSTSARFAAALFAVVMSIAALHEWRKIQAAVHSARHGPLSTDTGLEVHLKLAEARSFETGHGRIKSSKAACERFFKVLHMPPESELRYAHLPVALVSALHGALRTCPAFQHPTRRYDSLAAVISRHGTRLFHHRISCEVLERMLVDYLAASRSDYPCDANALLLCARNTEKTLRHDPLFRDRIASIALRESAMLPKSFDIERINALLAALAILDLTDGALPYVEQALLNEVVNLNDSSQRGLLISYLLNHAKISSGARVVLEGALKLLDSPKDISENEASIANSETFQTLSAAA